MATPGAFHPRCSFCFRCAFGSGPIAHGAAEITLSPSFSNGDTAGVRVPHLRFQGLLRWPLTSPLLTLGLTFDEMEDGL